MAPQRKSKRNDKKAQDFIEGAGSKPSPAVAPERSVKKPVALRFDVELLRRIDAAAARKGVSRNAWISYQCSEALDND